MPDGLGAALDRYSSRPAEENDTDQVGKQEPSDKSTTKGGKGHTFHVHKHLDGKHHLTVHSDHGQMVHHSEHDSLEEAAEEMKAHGE